MEKHVSTPEQSALDAVYRERNQVVVLALRMARELGLKCGIGLDRAAEAGWQYLLFIDLPTGQVSWHVPNAFLAEVLKTEILPRYDGEWDGHSTEEKYRRVTGSFALKDGRDQGAVLSPLEGSPK